MFPIKPIVYLVWDFIMGGLTVNMIVWWSDRLPIPVSMNTSEIEPAFVAVSLVKTRSMVDVCPLLSSLVGTFGSFMWLKERPCSHSRVVLVCEFGGGALSSQLGSLIFQLPAKIVGVEWWGSQFWSQSAIHPWVGLVLSASGFWLYMLISVMGAHVAASLPMLIIMKSRSCAMSVLSIKLIPIPSLWYTMVLGHSFLSMFSLGSVTCHPARDTVVNVKLISCHHGSWMSMMSKGGSLWVDSWCIAACVAELE